jgi:DnaK suppressor protein
MTEVQPTLTPEQISQLRSELQRTLHRIERSLKLSGNGRAPELDQSAVGRLSRIEALQNQGLTQNLKERERVQLEQVLDALRRLDAGTYGLCTSCNAAIRVERLLVFPEARTCSVCGTGN